MKLKHKFFASLMLAGSILGFASCSNEDVPEQYSESTLAPTEFLNITYNGKVYLNVPTAYDENKDFVFLDEDFSKIYEAELKELPTLSINLINDTDIEMFCSLESNLTKHGIDYSNIPTESTSATRTITSSDQNYIGTADLYDDKKFKDTQISLGITDAIHPVNVAKLKTYGFNDKCSSLKLWNHLPNDSTKVLNLGSYSLSYAEATLVFIGYDDHDYADRTYTALAAPSELKEYKELKNFNDKMSSCKLFFSERGNLTEGASK